MILGNICTRGCGFCSVPKGSPAKARIPAGPGRAGKCRATWPQQMELRYVVITSVNRDDLADGGSAISPRPCARCAARCRRRASKCSPRISAATWTPCGACWTPARTSSITTWRPCRAVPARAPAGRLPPIARRPAEAKRYRPEALTKSGLMVGLGENPQQVQELLRDLRRKRVDVVTIGQYLQPTRRNLPVAEYVTPAAVCELPANMACRSASGRSSAGRSCAVPTWRTVK